MDGHWLSCVWTLYNNALCWTVWLGSLHGNMNSCVHGWWELLTLLAGCVQCDSSAPVQDVGCLEQNGVISLSYVLPWCMTPWYVIIRGERPNFYPSKTAVDFTIMVTILEVWDLSSASHEVLLAHSAQPYISMYNTVLYLAVTNTGTLFCL